MKEAKYALSRRRPLQFGVRSLLIIMAAASCLFSFARVVFESRERARDTPPEPNNLVVGNGAYHECEPHYRWSRAPQGSDIRGRAELDRVVEGMPGSEGRQTNNGSRGRDRSE